MNDLSSEAKLLLRRARDEFSPREARLDAVRASLATRLAPGATPSSSVPHAGAAGARAAAWTTGHTAVTAFLAGAVAVGVYAFAPREERTSIAARSQGSTAAVATSVSAVDPPAAPIAEAVPRVDVGEEQHRPLVKMAPISDAARERPSELRAVPPSLRGAARFRGKSESTLEPTSAPAASAAVAPPVSPVAEPSDSLSDEVRLLREARAALDRGDASRALTSLDAHEARFPRGTLAEERLATRVSALCALGRSEAARAVAEELERTAPRSPHLARVRASCAASPANK